MLFARNNSVVRGNEDTSVAALLFLLAHPLLTQFLTGHGPLQAHGLGVGDPLPLTKLQLLTLTIPTVFRVSGKGIVLLVTVLPRCLHLSHCDFRRHFLFLF